MILYYTLEVTRVQIYQVGILNAKRAHQLRLVLDQSKLTEVVASLEIPNSPFLELFQNLHFALVTCLLCKLCKITCIYRFTFEITVFLL